MRFDNYITENTKEFHNIVNLLSKYDDNKLKNLLSISWIKLRESLSNTEQEILLNVINENYGTNYKNIYFINDRIGSISNDWENKMESVSQSWLALTESSNNNVLLTYGLIWAYFVSKGE